MRRNLMLVVGLSAVVGGCAMFSAHSDVIEDAAGQQLTAKHFAELLTSIHAPGIPYDAKVGDQITGIWTDMTLFAQAVATGKLKTDSALVSEAMWPMIAEATASRWIDTVIARRSNISDTTVDNAYKADKVRAVQHLLVKVDSSSPKEDKAAARKKAEDLLAQIRGGANFGVVAMANTDDGGSKADSGYYGLKPRETWDKPFGDALWALKPGEVSGIVTGHFGYHIIRRPSDVESRKLWRDSLTRAAAQPIIQAYYAKLSTDYNVKIDAAALPHMRSALQDLDSHANDHSAISTYKGGSFTTADFVRWITAATANPTEGPQRLAQLKSAPDSEFQNIAKVMTQSALLLEEAKKNGVKLTPTEWKGMQDAFTAAVDTVKAAMGLTAQAIDPKASEHDRTRAAAEKVDQYFNDLVSQKSQLKPLPGILAATLRARYKPKFNPVAMQHGLDLATAKRSADSVKAGGAGAAPTPGDLKPAPGGPPVDGGASLPPKKP